MRKIVLVVDDDGGIRAQIKSYLERRSMTVEEANSGESAVVLVQQLQPAVILMDVKMPGMGGIAAAEQIYGILPEAKTILMSGDHEKIVEANRNKEHVFTVIEKPVPLPILEKFVREALLSVTS